MDPWFTGEVMWSKILDHMLKSIIRRGSLTVELPDGQKLIFGDGTGIPASVRIADTSTLRHIILNPELAVGEAYMDGRLTVHGDDLRGFLSVVTANLDDADRVWWQRLRGGLRTAFRRLMLNNVPTLSRKNVAHHYDLSDRLYDLFLDSDRQYSCAYFRTPVDTLEQAQVQKKDHIARKLRLERGMHVLDIGCGWGGMALSLAKNYGTRVTGITLSEEQLSVARNRAKMNGVEDLVEFHLTDYRSVEGTFDRVVSVGMFEHVGLPHFDTYFDTVRKKLVPGGIALVHTIGIINRTGGTNPWIGKYIFPGGYIPSLSEVAASVERQGLRVTDVELLWLHYAETLHHWQERFEANAGKVAKIYDERFVRMWRFYLAACEQTFRHRQQCVFQFQLSNSAEAVPITRDYLYEQPQAIRTAAE